MQEAGERGVAGQQAPQQSTLLPWHSSICGHLEEPGETHFTPRSIPAGSGGPVSTGVGSLLSMCVGEIKWCWCLCHVIMHTGSMALGKNLRA